MDAGNPVALSPVQRLLRLLSNYRKEIRYIWLYAIVAGLINLSLPLGVQAIIGLLAGGGISASWAVLVLFVLVGAMFTGLLRLLQLSIVEYLQRRIFTESAIEFALRIPRINLEALRREYLPELVNRFFDTQTIQKGLPKILIDGTTASLQILFSLLLLSFYHSAFVFSSLLLLAVLSLLFWWTAPKGLETSLYESKYKYKLVYWLEELGRVASTFKMAGENRFPLVQADQLALKYLAARSKHWRILVIQFVSSIVFRLLVLGGFLILGSLLVMENQLNIGQFVAAEILVLFIVDSVEKLILLHETSYDVLTAIEKIGQVADLPLEREDGIRLEAFCAGQALDIELRNLSYQYADGEAPVLKNLSFRIHAGERVAVAGYNGSGKSTLMQVLSVMRRDFSGALLFNGLPKQNLNLRSLREHIGDFSSNEDIFKGSILENITLGRSGFPTSKVLQIVDDVGLSEFIRHQPAGFGAELLPGGKNIPRSVIAKILLARAVASEPSLLALEEPLGNLNFQDRLQIGRMLIDPNRHWTLVCATEDPLLAALCGRVLVLKAGEIIFDGPFDALKKTPHYERIFRENLEKENSQLV